MYLSIQFPGLLVFSIQYSVSSSAKTWFLSILYLGIRFRQYQVELVFGLARAQFLQSKFSSFSVSYILEFGFSVSWFLVFGTVFSIRFRLYLVHTGSVSPVSPVSPVSSNHIS